MFSHKSMLFNFDFAIGLTFLKLQNHDNTDRSRVGIPIQNIFEVLHSNPKYLENIFQVLHLIPLFSMSRVWVDTIHHVDNIWIIIFYQIRTRKWICLVTYWKISCFVIFIIFYHPSCHFGVFVWLLLITGWIIEPFPSWRRSTELLTLAHYLKDKRAMVVLNPWFE